MGLQSVHDSEISHGSSYLQYESSMHANCMLDCQPRVVGVSCMVPDQPHGEKWALHALQKPDHRQATYEFRGLQDSDSRQATYEFRVLQDLDRRQASYRFRVLQDPEPAGRLHIAVGFCRILTTGKPPVNKAHSTLFDCLLQNILVAGKPHLGTDRLIKILQAFRKHLTALGVQIHFGSCVTDLVVEHDRAVGVKLRGQPLTKQASFLLYMSMLSTKPSALSCL